VRQFVERRERRCPWHGTPRGWLRRAAGVGSIVGIDHCCEQAIDRCREARQPMDVEKSVKKRPPPGSRARELRDSHAESDRGMDFEVCCIDERAAPIRRTRSRCNGRRDQAPGNPSRGGRARLAARRGGPRSGPGLRPRYSDALGRARPVSGIPQEWSKAPACASRSPTTSTISRGCRFESARKGKPRRQEPIFLDVVGGFRLCLDKEEWDLSEGRADAHGCPACPHHVSGNRDRGFHRTSTAKGMAGAARR